MIQQIAIEKLKAWDKNPRSISKDAFKRLKKQLMMGQHSTLLVTPNEDDTYTVLGGNMRLKAYEAMNEEYPGIYKELACFEVKFIEELDGWVAKIGEQFFRNQFYKTKEDAMMAYSLSHNDRAGFYDADLLANIMPEFNLEWGDFAIDMQEAIRMDNLPSQVNIDKDKTYIVFIECKNDAEQGEIKDKLKELGYEAKTK